MKSSVFVLTLVASFFLASCGGGGGNSESSSPMTSPQPVISSVSSIEAQDSQTITISGTGFGNTPPQTITLGDGSVDTLGCDTTTPSLVISDSGAGKDAWAAGRQSCSNTDAIGVYLVSWTNSKIVLSGFGSALGTTSASAYEISAGDPIVVDVTGPNGTGDGLFDTVVAGGGATLAVSIADLPSGTPANVTVTGPNGYSTQLVSSQTLQASAGTYTVTSNPVTAGSSTYYPSLATQAVTVAVSATASATVNYSTIIPNNTKVLDSVGMSSLTVSPNGSTITLSTSSVVATSLAAGNVLASAPAPGAPNGLLVKILSVSTSGQTVTAQVQQATLEDAIQQATFQLSEVLGPTNTTADVLSRGKIPSFRTLRRPSPEATPTGGPCSGNSNTIELPFNEQLAEAGPASATLAGETDICPSFVFDLQINSFQLVSMNATVTLGLSTTIGLVDSVEENFDDRDDLPALESSPVVVLIGGVPIVVQFTLTPFVGLSGNTEASVYTGITAGSTVTVGVTYANGQFSPVDTTSSPVVTSTTTSVDGEASLKAYAGLQAGVLLDGFLAPNLSGDGYLQFSSSLTGNPCWSLDAGLEANVGVDVQFLGETLASYSSPDLPLFSTTLAQATTTCFGPTLSSVTPNMALVTSPQLTVALAGSNFAPDTSASFSGQSLATTFLDPSDLTAIVPASDLAVNGTFPVTVTNPDSPGGTSAPVSFTVSGVTVSISPTTVSVPVSTNQQFNATVQGTSNTGVTWSVDGIAQGNSTVGTITNQGSYTAPSTVPNPAAVTVTATSQANPSISASASVTITTLSYSFSALTYPGFSTSANGINGSAEVVGTYGPSLSAESEDYGSGGFSYAGGAYSIIEYPGTQDFQVCGTFAAQGAQGTGASDINDYEQIVGAYQNCSGSYGFLYAGGSFSSISYPGDAYTYLSGINNSGEIVGSYLDSSFNSHGFLYNGGTFSPINFPGVTSTYPYGINDSDQIVGEYVDSSGNGHAFLYSDGTFSTMDYPGAIGTGASGINNIGQIVGSYTDSSFTTHGFLYAEGTFTSIDYPGATGGFTAASGINDKGQIVGTYAPLANDLDLSGFLATPNQ
jgi:probable HAF family extracellular repeat protein